MRALGRAPPPPAPSPLGLAPLPQTWQGKRPTARALRMNCRRRPRVSRRRGSENSREERRDGRWEAREGGRESMAREAGEGAGGAAGVAGRGRRGWGGACAWTSRRMRAAPSRSAASATSSSFVTSPATPCRSRRACRVALSSRATTLRAAGVGAPPALVSHTACISHVPRPLRPCARGPAHPSCGIREHRDNLPQQ